MKKTLSLILTLILVLSTLTPVFGAPSDKELYNQSGEILKNVGVLQGSETGDLMLSKNLRRQDMVVLISRLYKQENTAKKYSVKSTFSDVKDSFYKPYISWAVDKGLIIGVGNNKFGFNDPVTVQQFQTLLLRTLEYSEETKDWANVPELAEKFNLMEGLSATPKQNVDRGLMAAMTVNALRVQIRGKSITLAQHLNLDIPDPFKVDAIAKIDKNTLKLEGVAKGIKSLKVNLKPISTNITSEEKVVNVPLKEDGRFDIEIPNLQSGKYEYKFVSGSQSTTAKSITIEELPFELMDIAATNLKEVALSFTAPVDKLSSLFSSNYSTNAGTVKSVRLEDNDTRIILTLNETMKNQKNFKLSANKIVSDKGKEIRIKDEGFTAFDNEIPKVKEIKPLGNKGLRIYMTEPVKSAKASNFKIDNKKFSGNVQLVDNVITLTYYSSYFAPEEGVHTLNVSDLEDYAGYRGVDEDISFHVVKDTEAPKIVDARATVEEAIIEFDEEIDPDSLSRTNFYRKSGSSKRYPTKVKVLNNKVILDYSGNTLPTYEISIYVDNIADYSGNKLKNGEAKVIPSVDKTNPEVVGIKVSEDGKSIMVSYSKNVEAKNRAYYSIKDKNNKTISIRGIEGSGREYKINLNAPLPIGINTITIQDVYDTTSSKNKLATFTQEIDMDDVEKPKVVSHSGKDREIMLLFNKEMDSATVTNYENYIINFDGKHDYLPKDADFDLIYDGKTWIIELPEKIDGKKIEIGRYGNIRDIQISGLRAANGVLIEPVTLKFDSSNQGEAKAIKAELIEPDTIKVEFNQPIHSASPDDFSLTDRRIYDVMVDGSNEINLILDNSDETGISGNLNIKYNNSIGTILETGVKSGYVSVSDKVPPTVKPDTDILRLSRYTIELPFTEKLEKEVEGLYKRDLIIETLGKKDLDQSDFSTELDSTGKIILIKVDSSVKAPDGYSVRLVDEPKYIMDRDGNVVEPSGYDYRTR